MNQAENLWSRLGLEAESPRTKLLSITGYQLRMLKQAGLPAAVAFCRFQIRNSSNTMLITNLQSPP